MLEIVIFAFTLVTQAAEELERLTAPELKAATELELTATSAELSAGTAALELDETSVPPKRHRPRYRTRQKSRQLPRPKPDISREPLLFVFTVKRYKIQSFAIITANFRSEKIVLTVTKPHFRSIESSSSTEHSRSSFLRSRHFSRSACVSPLFARSASQ